MGKVSICRRKEDLASNFDSTDTSFLILRKGGLLSEMPYF